MKTQPIWSEYLDPVKLKRGDQKCPCCGKLMRSYAKTLDKRLVGLLKEIVEYGKPTFNARNVFGEDHLKLTDFQKLGYWGFIERTESNGVWGVKLKAKQFLKGSVTVPKRLWIFNKEVIEEEDIYVHIDNLDDRWQEERIDWATDYVPKPMEPKIITKNGQTVAVIE